MAFFEGLEQDLRRGQRPLLLRAALWLLGMVDAIGRRLRGRRG